MILTINIVILCLGMPSVLSIKAGEYFRTKSPSVKVYFLIKFSFPHSLRNINVYQFSEFKLFY